MDDNERLTELAKHLTDGIQDCLENIDEDIIDRFNEVAHEYPIPAEEIKKIFGRGYGKCL